jgi:hypothetical protein
LNAVAVLRRRNIQPGTAILNIEVILMKKILALVLLLGVGSLILAACSDPNANLANTVGIGNVNVNQSDLPPGFSTSPLPMNGTETPGIPPANQSNAVPKGATPTPGIPDPKDVNKPIRPGATPTPGIPSPDEIRKQMRGTSNTGPSTQTEGTSGRETSEGPKTARKP